VTLKLKLQYYVPLCNIVKHDPMDIPVSSTITCTVSHQVEYEKALTVLIYLSAGDTDG
jgi:hypothetical protein